MRDFPDTIEIETAPEPSACVIWLHGLGANGGDLLPVARALDLPATLAVRHLLPDAPWRAVTLYGGEVMRAWYDVVTEDGRRPEVEAEVRDAQARIEALIGRERERGLTPERIVLAGFSQGGAMALHTGLRYLECLGGIAALSSVLPLADTLAGEASAANGDIPVFMAHGVGDPVIPLDRGRASRDRLLALGYRLTWREYDIAHTVCDAEVRDLGEWLRGTLGAG